MTVDYTKQDSQKLTVEQKRQIKILSFVFTALPLFFFTAGLFNIFVDILMLGEARYYLSFAFMLLAILEVIMWNLIIKKQILKKIEAQNETE